MAFFPFSTFPSCLDRSFFSVGRVGKVCYMKSFGVPKRKRKKWQKSLRSTIIVVGQTLGESSRKIDFSLHCYCPRFFRQAIAAKRTEKAFRGKKTGKKSIVVPSREDRVLPVFCSIKKLGLERRLIIWRIVISVVIALRLINVKNLESNAAQWGKKATISERVLT